jgi:ferrous iron transport protein B
LPGLFRIEAMNLSALLAETFTKPVAAGILPAVEPGVPPGGKSGDNSKRTQISRDVPGGKMPPSTADGTPAATSARNERIAEALLILSNEKSVASSGAHYPQKIQDAVIAARKRLEAQNIDWRGAPIEWRYTKIAEIQNAVTTETAPPGETFSDKLDKILTHKVWGTIIFIAVMALMFQSIFTFAKWPMDGLQFGVGWVGGKLGNLIPQGDLNDLLVNGVIAGVGAVVVFLPQILLLFLFIGFLEDTGYMSRAAFLMDRLMSKVGLHGKSFIPMLSSYACAIPGIMATRTIESPKDRLVTILVAPLMSCSARLPVYTLLIGACIPDVKVLGFLKLQGLTMLVMYLLGTVVALIMAWIFKKTLLKGETPMLIMELPPYKLPLFKTVLRHMWDRSKLFLRRAGTVILGISILLWFLATYPRDAEIKTRYDWIRHADVRAEFPQLNTPDAVDAKIAELKIRFASQSGLTETNSEFQLFKELSEIDKEEAGDNLRNSFAGKMGRAIEPVIAPLGFDWRMGIGIVASFAAREVFVSTMSTVYNVGNDASEEGTKNLKQTLREQKRSDGSPVYTTLTALSLMVFYVFALQCVSTVAVVRRETNSWKWPLFQWAYMGGLAWVFAFAVYRLGHLFGWH